MPATETDDPRKLRLIDTDIAEMLGLQPMRFLGKDKGWYGVLTPKQASEKYGRKGRIRAYNADWRELRTHIHTLDRVKATRPGYLPCYSTDIAAAMQVWEKLVEMERYPSLHSGPNVNTGEILHWVDLANPAQREPGRDTPALAICRAALNAVAD